MRHASRLLYERLTVGGSGRRRVRVPLDRLLDAWADALPELAGRPTQLTELADALADLAAENLIELPARRSWDRSSIPPLPLFVTVPAARTAPAPAPWRHHPWRPELGFVASLPVVGRDQFDALRAVNVFLSGAADEPVVPMRLRSAQLFGDEKLLDTLVASRLFGPGRLTLAMLRCERRAPPMALRRVGDGADVLVVENADPFWALCDVLGNVGGPIGTLAWGAGNQAEHSVPGLWQDGTVGEGGTVWYWGDLDPEGVRAATRAAEAAARAGYGTLVPHGGLWAALCALEPTGATVWPPMDGSWLGHLWERSVPLRRRGGRVAQERLGAETLAAVVQQTTMPPNDAGLSGGGAGAVT